MEGTRRAAKAGQWYEGNPTKLNQELTTNLANASRTQPFSKSIIGPHAGFTYSGPTAAWAYVHCDVESVRKVFLLGPSHRAYINGCGLPASSVYATPIGNIPVDTEIIEQLRSTGQFKQLTKSVEEGEHSLELHLPYIRKVFEGRDITLVPIMVGSVSAEMEQSYGEIFAQYYRDPEAMFIISTDFCHWGSNFDYRPYDQSKGERWEYIKWLDEQGVWFIKAHAQEAFRAYLMDTGNTICGCNPIGVLLSTINASGLSVRTEMVQYSQSNNVKSHSDMSVSYVSMPWIGLALSVLASFLDYGVQAIPIVRLAMMLPSILFKDFIQQICICYVGVLVSSVFTVTIIDVALLLFWAALAMHYSKSVRLLLTFNITFLICVQSVQKNKQSECLMFILGSVGIVKLASMYQKFDRFERNEVELISQISDLREIVEKRQTDHDFENYSRTPITSAKAQNLIEKLKNLSSGNIPGQFRFTPTNASGLSFQKLLRIGSNGEKLLQQNASFYSNAPEPTVTPDSSEGAKDYVALDALNLADGRRNSGRSSSEQSMGSLALSQISKNTSFEAHFGSQLSPEDIEDLISTILNREYLLWKTEDAQPEDLNIFKIGAAAKSKYMQSIQRKNANASYLEERYYPKENANLLRTMTEENNDLGEFLEGIGEWNFDTLSLNMASDKHPLMEVGQYVFQTLGLPYHFNIHNNNLIKFLQMAENRYNREVYYHNCIHAADVLNSMVFLLYNGLHRRGRMQDLDVFAVIVSAITHDIGHPGVNNAFLVSSGDPLSLKYNDQSVLENMHCGVTFELMEDPESNIVTSLDVDQLRQFRQTTIAIILATDLQKHFDKLAEFRKILNSEDGFIISNDEHKLIALEICLKCADIGHSAKKLSIHKVWTAQITKEFFRQGDLEKAQGLPVSQLCDRDTVNIAESQKGFLNIMALPLFELWEEFIEQEEEVNSPSAPHRIMTHQIHLNNEFWEREMEVQTFYLDHAPPMSTLKRERRIRTTDPKTRC